MRCSRNALEKQQAAEICMPRFFSIPVCCFCQTDWEEQNGPANCYKTERGGWCLDVLYHSWEQIVQTSSPTRYSWVTCCVGLPLSLPCPSSTNWENVPPFDTLLFSELKGTTDELIFGFHPVNKTFTQAVVGVNQTSVSLHLCCLTVSSEGHLEELQITQQNSRETTTSRKKIWTQAMDFCLNWE